MTAALTTTDLEALADALLADADETETPTPAKIAKSPATITVNGNRISKRNVRFEGPAVALFSQWSQENETSKACSGSSNPAFIDLNADAAHKTAALTMCLGDDTRPACPLLSACAFWAETAFKDLEGIMAGRIMTGSDDDEDTPTVTEETDFNEIISSLRRTQAIIEENTQPDDLLAQLNLDAPFEPAPTKPARYTGPARSIPNHIALVFASQPVGAFLKVSDIVNTPTTEYPNSKPSSGAVTSQMKSKKFAIPGLQVTTRNGISGIIKNA